MTINDLENFLLTIILSKTNVKMSPLTLTTMPNTMPIKSLSELN